MTCPKCHQKNTMEHLYDHTTEGPIEFSRCVMCGERIYWRTALDGSKMDVRREERAYIKESKPCGVIGCKNNARIRGGEYGVCNPCKISIEAYSDKFRSIRRVKLNDDGEWELNHGA